MSGAFGALARHREQVKVRASMAEVQRNLDALPPVERVESTEVRTPESDLEALRQTVHEVESSYKPEANTGFRVPRPLPARFREQIARLPADHPLRTGAVKPYFDVMTGTWKANMKAPAQAAKSEGGHFSSAMFANTARRYDRERGEGIR
jgi:hypothetical protein